MMLPATGYRPGPGRYLRPGSRKEPVVRRSSRLWPEPFRDAHATKDPILTSVFPKPALAALFLPALVLGAVSNAPPVQADARLDANVVDQVFPTEELSFPAFDGAGAPAGSATWRVVSRSGNSAENYLGMTPGGRLLDFGGTYLNYSDDGGVHWHGIRSLEPQALGEGAVVAAPGGDVVGVGWYGYTGDKVVSFKYEAASKKWLYQHVPLHTPFYDRPWIGVIPGPFTVGAVTAPYLTVMRGGWPLKEFWYYSLDGLNYFVPGSRLLDEIARAGVQKALAPAADPAADYYQSHMSAGVFPVPGVGALSTDDTFFSGDPMSLMQAPDLRWSSFRFKSGKSPMRAGGFATDSVGRLHNVVVSEDGDSFLYQLSADGGRSWHGETIEPPGGATVEHVDFKANGSLGLTAVAVHAQGDSFDQDLVYTFSTESGRPFLERRYHLGAGDADFTAGLGASVRMDFTNLVIFPDGRIATSFKDADHDWSAIAILLEPPSGS